MKLHPLILPTRTVPTLRKTLAGSGIALVFFASGLIGADVPLLQYNFDEGSGTTVANSGSLGSGANLTFGPTVGTHLTWASSSSTVSGIGSALVSDGVTRTAQPGYLYGNGSSLNTGLNAFTITMWVNLNQTGGPQTTDRLFSFYNGSAGFELQVNTSASTTPLTLFVNGSQISSSASTTVLGDWAFVAVTYDGLSTSNNVNFYTGGTSVSATTLGTARTLDKSSVGTLASPTESLRIGNPSTTNTDRSPAGLFDDVRIYGSALDASSIEAVRVSAVAIPEPSSAGLIFAVAGMFAAGVMRRRRR